MKARILPALCCALLLGTGPGFAGDTPEAPPLPKVPARDEPLAAELFDPVGRLVGRCWEGEIAPGLLDVQCYEWAVQRAFVRVTHEVTGSNGTYTGETFYGWDEDEERLRFWYFNSLGGTSSGHVETDGDTWLAFENYDGAGQKLEMRTRMALADDDHYTVVTERKGDDGTWGPMREIAFTAAGSP